MELGGVTTPRILGSESHGSSVQGPSEPAQVNPFTGNWISSINLAKSRNRARFTAPRVPVLLTVPTPTTHKGFNVRTLEMLLRYLPSLARQRCLRTTTTAATLGRNVWEDLLSIEEPARPGIVGGVLDRWAASGKVKVKRRSSFDGAASPRDAKLRPPPPAVPPAPQLLKGLQGRPDLAAGILAYRRAQVRLSSGPQAIAANIRVTREELYWSWVQHIDCPSNGVCVSVCVCVCVCGCYPSARSALLAVCAHSLHTYPVYLSPISHEPPRSQSLAPYTRCLKPFTLLVGASGTSQWGRLARAPPPATSALPVMPTFPPPNCTLLQISPTHSCTHSLYHTPSLTRPGTISFSPTLSNRSAPPCSGAESERAHAPCSYLLVPPPPARPTQ